MTKSLLNYLGCFFINIIFLFLKVIRKKNSINISAFLFGIIGPFTKLNKRAEKNLIYIWPKISKEEINKIFISMWKNLGKNFGEFIFLHDYDPIKCKNTKIFRLENVNSLISENKRKGKGVIFFSAHFGHDHFSFGVLFFSSF